MGINDSLGPCEFCWAHALLFINIWIPTDWPEVCNGWVSSAGFLRSLTAKDTEPSFDFNEARPSCT